MPAMGKASDRLSSELEMSERRRLQLKRSRALLDLDSGEMSQWVMVDLMTLVLAFFIMLYASRPELPSFAQMPRKSEAAAVKEKTRTFPDNRKILHAENGLKEAGTRLRQVWTGMDSQGNSVQVRADRIVLVIGEEISFEPGRADLLEPIKIPLEKVAQFIDREYVYRVIVSGHTDDTPIHTRQFPSNWELSLARAFGVAKFLLDRGVDPYRMSVEGFGAFDPVADNGTPSGRQANRRVEITLLKGLNKRG
ncbi:OmpA family protein [Desulfospira joergensenii]|uniref:OmpA family protein n=1 Tax=Desulfospira joergensenii TaxID=53329 RepID=UPI0003B59C3E|nr:OmpA family protein [Desulfospira joergensenii]